MNVMEPILTSLVTVPIVILYVLGIGLAKLVEGGSFLARRRAL